MAKTHPHFEMASLELIEQTLAPKGELGEIVLELHQLIIDCLPDIRWSLDTVDMEIGYGAHQYGYDGWGMLAVMAYTKWVNLYFVNAADLPDPEGLLEGKMKHHKFTSVEQVHQHADSLRTLFLAAAECRIDVL